MTPHSSLTTNAGNWLAAADCRLEDFRDVVEHHTDVAAYPLASEVVQNVVVYDSERLRAAMVSSAGRRNALSELASVLLEGPGVAVFRGAYTDLAVVDRATDAFSAMIEEQHAAGVAVGDHYAKPGANDRVWNALEKLALRDPAGFVDYYSNDIIALASSAWLGPAYQVTSQINLINPGGEAQQPHRDYHLGFLTDDEGEQYPAHVHPLSGMLTLQGAVAHVDMPVESGPTMLLPHSQKYVPGFLAWRRPEFKAYFLEHYSQLSLAKGDAMFFNPAVFHAGGHNRTNHIKRMANLLQISSAFGRALEAVDREAIANAIYPALLERAESGAADDALQHAIAAAAEGYAFPTNLDRDQPIGGLAPPSQADVVRQALAQRWEPTALASELSRHSARRRTA